MKLQSAFLKLSANRFIQHFLFWVLSYYLLLKVFSTGSEAHQIDYYYTFLFHIPLLIGVYINLELFIPKLLARGYMVSYLFAVPALILIAVFFNLWFFDHLVDKIFADYYFISYYEFIDIVQFFLIYISITSLLKLSRGWFQLAKTEEKLALANRKKLEAELKVLKSQINPHFLFNSLNNLYSLALKQDAQTPEVILQLSESMRYIIYECKEDRVSLEREISFLKNYIELQKLRSNAETTIEFNVQGNPSELKIAPLLFIPFVENGFKHGVKGDTDSGFIKIQINIEDQNIFLQVINNIGVVDEVDTEESNGIGLENVRQRLQLIYPKAHELEIIDGKKDFEIKLRINLS